MELSIDIETFSGDDIKKVGVYKYVQHPLFQIILFAFKIDDGSYLIFNIDQLQLAAVKEQIREMIRRADTITAFNAQFEREALSVYLGEYLDPEKWHCTMAMALRYGLPGSLDGVAKALNLSQQKDKKGSELIKIFCGPIEPKKSNGFRVRWTHEDLPAQWNEFKRYCIQDVRTEDEIKKRLRQFNTQFHHQHRYYVLDQRINDYGVNVDYDFVLKAIALSKKHKYEYQQKIRDKYKSIENPNSGKQLLEYISAELNHPCNSLNKKVIPALRRRAADNEDVLTLLDLREEISKTSNTKYDAIKRAMCRDGRCHGMLLYYGANRTGRYASKIINLQNLKRNKEKDLEIIRSIYQEANLYTLRMLFDDVNGILSQLIRTSFIASGDGELIVTDFNQVEARILSWLADEIWRVEIFSRPDAKIYEATASKMFKINVDDVTPDQRQTGKICDLALGFGGSIGALITAGALEKPMSLDEEELKPLVYLWRDANQNIVKFWKKIERAVKLTIADGVRRRLKNITIYMERGCLFIQLPSGRCLCYFGAKLVPSDYGFDIMYQGKDKDTGVWTNISTYGGKLTENIVQAIALDILNAKMLQLHKAGFKIVLHVHDEIVIDYPGKVTEAVIRKVDDIMKSKLHWCLDLQHPSKTFGTKVYLKD